MGQNNYERFFIPREDFPLNLSKKYTSDIFSTEFVCQKQEMKDNMTQFLMRTLYDSKKKVKIKVK